MGKLWGKKDYNELLGSPQETMGFSKEYSSLLQNFIIRKYDFTNLNQVEDIKNQLLKRKILILNAKDILENVDVSELKRGIEDLKSFLRENGGSMGRLGEHYLIMTPNAHVKIAN
ncbi:MAG: cell division protein SepF [Candidatus Lokiarchaeota archaeon]|nr:cell division protein SepF [Candidatus Lokiarchaeota archaeon]